MNATAKFKITKFQGLVLSIFLISVLMTAVMSLGMLVIQGNSFEEIAKNWWQQFLLGCSIAVPAGFVLVPLIQKGIELITDPEAETE